MKTLSVSDLSRISGMFLDKDKLIFMTNPLEYPHGVDSWEMVFVPLTPLPMTPEPIPASPQP